MRSMSDVQEAAQYLSGDAFPTMVLKGLLGHMNVPHARLVHLSPYDASVETVSMKFHQTSEKSPRIKSLSLTATMEHGVYSEQVTAVRLLKEGTRVFAHCPLVNPPTHTRNLRLPG